MGLIPGSRRSPGEGNGNLLRNSCLGKPMDRRAWWATVHEVTKESGWTYKLNNNSSPREVTAWGRTFAVKSWHDLGNRIRHFDSALSLWSSWCDWSIWMMPGLWKLSSQNGAWPLICGGPVEDKRAVRGWVSHTGSCWTPSGCVWTHHEPCQDSILFKLSPL